MKQRNTQKHLFLNFRTQMLNFLQLLIVALFILNIGHSNGKYGTDYDAHQYKTILYRSVPQSNSNTQYIGVKNDQANSYDGSESDNKNETALDGEPQPMQPPTVNPTEIDADVLGAIETTGEPIEVNGEGPQTATIPSSGSNEKYEEEGEITAELIEFGAAVSGYPIPDAIKTTGELGEFNGEELQPATIHSSGINDIYEEEEKMTAEPIEIDLDASGYPITEHPKAELEFPITHEEPIQITTESIEMDSDVSSVSEHPTIAEFPIHEESIQTTAEETEIYSDVPEHHIAELPIHGHPIPEIPVHGHQIPENPVHGHHTSENHIPGFPIRGYHIYEYPLTEHFISAHLLLPIPMHPIPGHPMPIHPISGLPFQAPYVHAPYIKTLVPGRRHPIRF